MPNFRVFFWAIFLLSFSSLIAPVSSASSSCKVSSVSKCVSSIKSKFPKTKSASSFCSSVLKCTTTPTTTLKGTVTITVTSTSTQTYVAQFFTEAETLTSSYTLINTEYTRVPYSTTTTTFTAERFEVTTVQPRRRWEILAGRAATTCCPTSVQSKACSCMVKCPATVTKDKRKTVIKSTTDVTVTVTTSTIYDTLVVFSGTTTTTTDTIPFVSTKGVYTTNTRTVKCTPSVANPSFYLLATDVPAVPSVNQKFVKVLQSDDNTYFEDFLAREWFFTQYKAGATLFTIDSSKFLKTPTSRDGDVFAFTDYFGPFEGLYSSNKASIDLRSFLYASCKLLPPSGRFAGGYKELSCFTDTSAVFSTGGYTLSLFEYCPEYLDFGLNPLNLANFTSTDSPTCYTVTFLAVPACGSTIAGQ